MNKLVSLLLLLLVGCQFDYYWNPYRLLKLTQEAIQEDDLGKLYDVLDQRAMCEFGSREGLEFLQKNLGNKNIKPELILLEKKENSSSSTEKYIAKLIDDSNNSVLGKVNIRCKHWIEGGSRRSYCSITNINLTRVKRVVPICSDLAVF